MYWFPVKMWIIIYLDLAIPPLLVYDFVVLLILIRSKHVPTGSTFTGFLCHWDLSFWIYLQAGITDDFDYLDLLQVIPLDSDTAHKPEAGWRGHWNWNDSIVILEAIVLPLNVIWFNHGFLMKDLWFCAWVW